MSDEAPQSADSLINPAKPKDSSVILEALSHAEKEFRDYNELCRRIDSIYSAREDLGAAITGMFTDQAYDTFWASMEVLKPAIYAKAPQVVAKPRFSDATATDKVVAELIERVVNSEFERNGIDMHLREVRDDLALLNRGVLRVTYEAEGGEKRICVDHVDRLDFLHEPVRYWPDLGWEAVCAWMTQKQMEKRFKNLDSSLIRHAGFVASQDRHDDEEPSDSAKAPVWEVWSKTDDRVYWVTEGIDVILDEDKPHLGLRDFFPVPRPAYGTIRRRTLIPIPDYIRYASHLDQINVLTSRIYTLLDRVRVTGLVPAGGDVATAIQTAMAGSDDVMLIPVPGAAMGATGSEFVQWLPIDVIATTITGLIAARTQLFADFDRLSGISDIMRGETEADETLGAQRIKTQYGSVRVKDKTEEIVRLARDVARVAVEIVCDKFDKDTLLEISQMVIPSKRDVERDLDGIKKAATEELKALTAKAKEASQQQGGQQIDPNQAQQMLQQAQQQIAEKYAPDLQRLSNTVVIEDVMKVIKDKRDRALIIDIETDSTVMMDEVAEKQAGTEMLQAFTGAMSALPQFAAMGEQGIKLFGSVINFSLQSFTRGNRQIQTQLDELIESAPEIAERMQAMQGDQGTEELAKAQQTLADAEMVKAQAATKQAEAKAASDQATNQFKMAELQGKLQDAETKAQNDNGKLQLQLADSQTKAQQAQQLMEAKINNLEANTAKLLASIGFDARKQDLDEYTAASNEQARVVDQEMQAVGSEREHARAERGEDRADRGQDFTERSTDREFEAREQEGSD